jgi:haloacetate dehalogenase
MEGLGHARFRLAGHDRGGRVAYRLALDHPGRLEKLAVLDIVPTWAMWHRMDARLANRAWHWMFLALPAPFPERMIGKDPLYFFDTRAAAGTKIKDLAAFDPRALVHYHAFFNDPVRIRATCEDYRAGRTTDLAHDEETRAAGQKIACPLLAIWGAAGGIPAETADPLTTWRECAALPSTAGTISPRRRRRRRPRHCSSSLLSPVTAHSRMGLTAGKRASGQQSPDLIDPQF